MARSCSGCKEKRPAHSLCTNCNKWLCSLCTEEHEHSKDAGEHFLPIPLKACSGAEVGASEFPLFCPVHSQETLKMFCETCDALTCHCCLLAEHKEHRFRHLQEALQNQRVILETVTTKVEEKKSGVQVSAKQIEDRLFEVKHLQRKVENQIKMAKMVLMNEINKRANVLLEQLERITSERKQKLEQQLQGIVVLNRQFEHVQNFLSWAVCSKNSVPFLFSKELIVFQIQRLLETNYTTDVGPPWKIRFTWDPSFWTKQLSNLGHLSMEGGQILHSDVPAYGSMQGMQPALYHHHHGHHSPAPQHDPLSHQGHQFQPPVHCATQVCCTHCLNIPHMNKGQFPHQTMSHPQTFRQPPEVQHHQHQQHFPPQYSLQQHEREQRCASRPLKTMQPGLEQKSHQEHDNVSARVGQHSQEQLIHQATHPVYPLPPQDDQPDQAGHSQQLPVQAALQTPTVQVQLGPLQKLKLNHGQQTQPQEQPPPPLPLSPPQPSATGPNEKAHEQVIQQSLDIMHHQFELEEMKKDLELLLQAQQPSLQLNQTKQPQHVQQTIVGQINYIVRQPAPVQQQSQEEAQQVGEDSMEPEGQKAVLPLDKNVIPPIPQPLEETNVSIHSPESTLNPVRKRSASLNIVGFSNALEMELSATRAFRTADSQAQEVSPAVPGQSQSMPNPSDVQPEAVPGYSLVLDRTTNDLCSDTINHLTTGGMPLVSAVCKLETEEFNPVSYPLGRESTATESKDMNELSLPMQNILEEPINLSVKKTQPRASPPTHTSSASCIQSANPKQPRRTEGSVLEDWKVANVTPIFKKGSRGDPGNYRPVSLTSVPDKLMENILKDKIVKHIEEQDLLGEKQHGFCKDCHNCEEEHFEMEIKTNQNNRPCAKEVKVPYVRLERLKICTTESGELPVFKLQPQKSEHDGTFLLIIECGAQTSSMAIKVNQGNPPERLYPKPENPEDRRILTGQPTEQVLLPSVDHRLSNSMKKSVLSQEDNPIENEDFCAVCLNGGELLCCDYCPKVFHLSCHVPALLSFPVGEWVCTLCRNMEKPEVEYDCENTRFSYSNTLMPARALYGLDDYDQKKCEKLVLSLLCNSLSLPFHEPVSPLARHYYQIIKRPMDLSSIRKKLQKKDKLHYSTSEELVADVRLMFWNCATFNYPDSEVAEAGRCLEMFFESKLKEVYPEKQFSLVQQDDSDSEEVEHENSHVGPKGFQWPSYRQECIQPKRRRRHAESEKTKRPMFWPAKGLSQV
ncbi:tripartite motif-containing protein 66 isoform X2 [Hemicordylus capensis]|uniref:tripartite motif-containing protein 66 isoform X2 n=1 Tax=Hemicordylus capensis TaxID=884348 RepID=UPI0023030D40|nr:tripartite motif-containing protein 66 isoform X2 [Hemicordylus capensis]